MRHVLINIIAAFSLLTTTLHAATLHEGDNSPVAMILETNKDAKTLDGAKLRIAKPFLKRTPMGVILDEINMMVICPLELDPQDDNFSFAIKAKDVLKGYNMVREIDDEKSTMTIYIDTPENNRFSEIVLYNTKPQGSIMLFVGDFTVESLIKVGEESEQQRKNLKKNK